VLLLLTCCHGDTIPWTPANQRDTKDDPAVVRPGYGDAQRHLWWPVSETERIALGGVQQARQGDMNALLALGLIASGDHKPPAALLEFEQRVERFAAEIKPAVDAADEWHKGYEINRAMHRVFFHEDKADLQNYSLDVARLTDVFTTGHYNCISSAMLYAILARGFALPVRGVVMPEHAFIELGPPGGKTIEVETTTATGYDWVHDERFYRDGAKDWSSKRGLRPMTLDDYKQRRVIEPATLMAHSMIDSRSGESDEDRAHLSELAAVVAPDDPDVQKAAVSAYINEANALREKKATRTLAKMLDVVSPTLEDLATRSKDPEVLMHVMWAREYRARALLVVNRADEAVAITDESLKRIDPSWKDAMQLRTGFVDVISDHLLELVNAKDYANAVKFITPRFEVCKTEDLCAQNVSIIYRNQAIEHDDRGDWAGAKHGLEECIQLLPKVPGCAELLDDLKARH
jgi:tetratricopeptide (TPR) repeat protein